jgi:hypothetical protein
MIIDLILDRRDNENWENFEYSAHDFYIDCMRYGKIGDEITSAMDYGTEADTKKALCNYIDNNNYNPLIKNYIMAREWNSDQHEPKPIIEIL